MSSYCSLPDCFVEGMHDHFATSREREEKRNKAEPEVVTMLDMIQQARALKATIVGQAEEIAQLRNEPTYQIRQDQAAVIADAEEMRGVLEGQILHWKEQFQIASTMVQEKKEEIRQLKAVMDANFEAARNNAAWQAAQLKVAVEAMTEALPILYEHAVHSLGDRSLAPRIGKALRAIKGGTQ